jgi:hypothetical protein
LSTHSHNFLTPPLPLSPMSTPEAVEREAAYALKFAEDDVAKWGALVRAYEEARDALDDAEGEEWEEEAREKRDAARDALHGREWPTIRAGATIQVCLGMVHGERQWSSPTVVLCVLKEPPRLELVGGRRVQHCDGVRLAHAPEFEAMLGEFSLQQGEVPFVEAAAAAPPPPKVVALLREVDEVLDEKLGMHLDVFKRVKEDAT